MITYSFLIMLFGPMNNPIRVCGQWWPGSVSDSMREMVSMGCWEMVELAVKIFHQVGQLQCQPLNPALAHSYPSLQWWFLAGSLHIHPVYTLSLGWTALPSPSVNPHSVIEVPSSNLFGHPVLTFLLPHRAHCPCSWVTLYSSFYVMGSSLLSPPPFSN